MYEEETTVDNKAEGDDGKDKKGEGKGIKDITSASFINVKGGDAKEKEENEAKDAKKKKRR